MTVAIEVPVDELVYQGYIDPALWGRLTNRIVSNLEFQQYFGTLEREAQQQAAARIMNEAVAFLLFTAKTDRPGSPSPLVDIAWENFVLYTPLYAEWCDRHAGRFIHHNPSDEEGVDYLGYTPAQTATAMTNAGYAVDVELWKNSHDGDCQGDGGDCSAGGGKCEPLGR
jgi:hypothetical protein